MTTILSVRKGNKVIIAGDGQITLGNTVLKGTTSKIRRLESSEAIVAGFAGSTSDALVLFQRLEAKLDKYPKQLKRACVELAKDWASDKYLRKLEATMIVADKNITLLITGHGDIVAPEHGVAATGSGGGYAMSAARALIDVKPKMDLIDIVKKSMKIAADICIYTNHHLHIEEI